ncbi:unnamed protein product, partial [Prorocentrum cordatum]
LAAAFCWTHWRGPAGGARLPAPRRCARAAEVSSEPAALIEGWRRPSWSPCWSPWPAPPSSARRAAWPSRTRCACACKPTSSRCCRSRGTGSRTGTTWASWPTCPYSRGLTPRPLCPRTWARQLPLCRSSCRSDSPPQPLPCSGRSKGDQNVYISRVWILCCLPGSSDTLRDIFVWGSSLGTCDEAC